MKVNVLDQKGKEASSVDLNDSIFGLEFNQGLVHRALVYQLANARRNIAHTKTRGERRGSTRKIYRQKGTGRARMGSNRSPIRRKGGVVFGPRNNQNFSISMNKKERRKALFCVLSEKLRNKQLIVVNDIKLKEIKTKHIVDIFNKLPYEKNALIAIPCSNEFIEKSSNNLTYVKVVVVNYLNIKDLLKYNTLVLLEGSLSYLDGLLK